MPSDWVVYDDSRVLDVAQKQLLQKEVSSQLNISVPKIVGLKRKEWHPIFRQLYGKALSVNPGRIEVLNGNYGLNRGLASAALVLTILSSTVRSDQWRVTLALGIAALIYGYRMHLFAVGFAREVYVCFLNSGGVSATRAAAGQEKTITGR